MRWVLDMDGVIWRGIEAIEGSVEAVRSLHEQGHEVAFVTNNSAQTIAGYQEKLASFGIIAERKDIITAGQAVARLCGDRIAARDVAGVMGQRPSDHGVLCVAGEGAREALKELNVRFITPEDVEEYALPEVDAVIVGIHASIGYRELSLATRGVLQSKRLFAPSTDPLYPVADGFNMGGGSLTHAVVYATGVKAEIAGKPTQHMADFVKQRLGEVDVVVGDQLTTDGELARRMGVAFVLVRTGVAGNARSEGKATPVALDSASLAEAVVTITADPSVLAMEKSTPSTRPTNAANDTKSTEP